MADVKRTWIKDAFWETPTKELLNCISSKLYFSLQMFIVSTLEPDNTNVVSNPSLLSLIHI